MTHIQFYGVRGSYPVAEKEMMGYGGNTSCVFLQDGRDNIIIDAGTGIIKLGEMLRSIKSTYHLFLTHKHWDHVQGLPYFGPLYNEGSEVHLYIPSVNETSNIIADQVCAPYFPFGTEQIKAKVHQHVLGPNEAVPLSGTTMRSVPLHHPGGSFGYVFTSKDGTASFLWDHEHLDRENSNIVGAVMGSDLLVYDAYCSDDEYRGWNGATPKKGWGHSTPTIGAHLARKIGASKLLLFHHAPDKDDASIDALVADAQRIFKNTEGARDGMMLDLAKVVRG